MKRFLSLFFFCMLFTGRQRYTAVASPLDCESLPHADSRNYCRAMSKGDKSYCELIHDQALRYQCRAMITPPRRERKQRQ